MRRLTLLIGIALLSGCAFAPRYVVEEFRPGAPETSEYEGHAGDGQPE